MTDASTMAKLVEREWYVVAEQMVEQLAAMSSPSAKARYITDTLIIAENLGREWERQRLGFAAGNLAADKPETTVLSPLASERKDCSQCYGQGMLLDADVTCPRCKGDGKEPDHA